MRYLTLKNVTLFENPVSLDAICNLEGHLGPVCQSIITKIGIFILESHGKVNMFILTRYPLDLKLENAYF